MSLLNLLSSAVLKNAFGTSGSSSSLSGPREYGTLLLALAIPVSYLQPPLAFRGGSGRESEWWDRGEGFEAFRLAEGDLECGALSRGHWLGVEGNEVDCCGLRAGRGELLGESAAGFAPDILGLLGINSIGERGPWI